MYAFDAINFPEGLSLALTALSSHEKGKLARLVPMGSVDDDMRRGHEVLDVYGGLHFRDQLSQTLWERLPGYLESGAIKPTSYNAIKSALNADAVNAALDEYRDGKKVVKPQIHI